MATFKLDGTTYTPYPRTIQWTRPLLARGVNGRPVYSIYYEAVITFPTMLVTLWDDFASKFTDSATHTIMLPHPVTNTDTTYSGVYIELISNDRDLGLYVYNAQIKVTGITSA